MAREGGEFTIGKDRVRDIESVPFPITATVTKGEIVS